MSRNPESELFEDVHRTSGMPKPSGFGEYDNLTGYVSGVYASQWTDRDGTVYLRTQTVINLGRPDRGRVVNPDKMIQEQEEWGDEQGCMQAAWDAVSDKARKRRQTIAQLAEAYLAEHGPARVRDIAQAIEYSDDLVLVALRDKQDKFVCLARGLYGLVGQERTARGLTPAGMQAYDYLMEHGPLSVYEIAKGAGIRRETIRSAIASSKGVFHVVRTRVGRGFAKPTAIWGLVGVHNREDER